MKTADTIKFHDEIASFYDELVEQSVIANKIRSDFHRQVLTNFKTGNHILEIGCGTGTDTIFLARHGIKITATDISANMIEILNKKISGSGFKELIKTHVMDVNQPADFGQKFDGMISNFSVINYAEDLPQLSKYISQQLKPGAVILMTLLNKICLWDVVYNLFRLNPKKAYNKITKRESDYLTKMHLYFPKQVKKIFSDNFKVQKIQGYGLSSPPDNLSGLYQRFKRFFEKTGTADKSLGKHYPFYNFCDQFIIELRKR